MDEAEESKEEGGGAGWVMTFADLMSLLMCFFVLLLSFSEMDVLKFKRLAGSMKQAFGVQQQLRANDPPKGTSIIAQEFSPGTPRPTPLNEIWQKTTDESRNSLDVACQDMGSSNSGESGDAQTMVVVDQIKDLVGETEKDAIDLAQALAREIAAGVLEIETAGRQITLRIKEHGNFSSGSAELSSQFKPSSKSFVSNSGTLKGASLWRVIQTVIPSQPLAFAPTGRSRVPVRWQWRMDCLKTRKLTRIDSPSQGMRTPSRW